MVQKLAKSKMVDLEGKVRALPRNFAIGDFFSGAGTFHLVVQASLAAFEKILPIECTDELEARFTKSLRCKL